MSSGMNLEKAKEYAKTITYSEAVANVYRGKGVKYRKATMIKLRELAEIADRLDHKTESNSEKPNDCTNCGCTDDCTECHEEAKWCKDEPQTNCDTCKYDISEDDYDLYDMCEPMVEGECRYEPKDEPQRDCFLCKWLGEVNVCGRCRNRNLFCEAEPQTIRCPNCGRTDYIRDMEKDMGIKGSGYKYKCINCNTYIKDES